MKKRLITSSVFLLLSIFLLVTALFALFTDSAVLPPRNIQSGEGSFTEISSEYLLRKYAYDLYYNPDTDVSVPQISDNGGNPLNKGQRENLVLMSDITLSYDLLINRDINIDLNGKTLDLNGYDLTIEHGYYGTLYIRDSSQPQSGSIMNSKTDGDESSLIYLTPNAIIVNGATVTGVNEKRIFQNGVLDASAENLAILKERILAYAKLDEVYLGKLGRTDGVNDSGYIELATHYFNTDITFTWESSNPGCVSAEGWITALSVDTDVFMTLTIATGGWQDSVTYKITVPSLTNDRIAYGIKELEEFFGRFNYGTNEAYIYGDLTLPSKNVYFYLDYEYTASPVSSDGFDNIVNNVLKKNEKSRKLTLTVDIDNNEGARGTAQFVINIVAENNLNTADNIVKGLDVYIIIGPDSEIVLPTADELSPHGIIFSEDMFTLLNNLNNDGEEYYYIEDGVIKVNRTPPSGYISYVKMNFNFIAGEPRTVEKNVPIFYIDTSGGSTGEGGDRLAYLYNLLNDYVYQRTLGGSTTKTFTMPMLETNVGITYFIEAPAGFPADALKLLVDSESGVVTFNIDPTLVPTTDSLIKIYYKFDTSEEQYSRYSSFVIPGVVNNNSEGIPDINLYKAVLYAYDADADGVLTVLEASEAKILFTPRADLASLINNYQGIKYLKNTQEINLDNSNFYGNANNAAYLLELKQITALSLRNTGLNNNSLGIFVGFTRLQRLDIGYNTGITNLTNLNLYNTVTTFAAPNCAVTDFSGIKKYSSIMYLYMQNNNIRLFDPLLDMKGLTEVYIYHQTQPIISGNYGPKGNYNFYNFTILTSRGVKVYNGYENNTPQLFILGSAKELELYQVLGSIVYNKNANTSLTLPRVLYVGSTQTGQSYTISWNFSSLAGASSSVSGNNIIINHNAPAGVYEIYGSITEVINGSSVTVVRVFMVNVT